MSIKNSQSYQEELPNPDSPLPAWQHYGILKYAEEKIQSQFTKLDFKGHLISLGIGYTIISSAEQETETWYKMSFGPDFGLELSDEIETTRSRAKDSDDLEELVEPEQAIPSPPQDPLTDNFIRELYRDVCSLVLKNITHSSEVHVTLLAATASASADTIFGAIECKFCKKHNTNHLKKYKLTWLGPRWVCQNIAC